MIDKKAHAHTKKKASPPSSTANILPAPKTAKLNEKNLQTKGKKRSKLTKLWRRNWSDNTGSRQLKEEEEEEEEEEGAVMSGDERERQQKKKRTKEKTERLHDARTSLLYLRFIYASSPRAIVRCRSAFASLLYPQPQIPAPLSPPPPKPLPAKSI